MGKRGKVTPNITTIVKMVRGRERKTMYFRNRIESRLNQMQARFYESGDVSREKMCEFVLGNVQAGAITKNECETLHFWVMFWGETWDNEPVKLNDIWSPNEVNTDVGIGPVGLGSPVTRHAEDRAHGRSTPA